MSQHYRIHMSNTADPVAANARRVLERTLRERGDRVDAAPDDRAIDLQLAIVPDGPREGFRIADTPEGGIRIAGHDPRGLVYGIGRFLCEPAWRGETTPAQPVRGMYLATHFNNWYHVMPIERVEAYVEELALWGCNTLFVWFDMHHYTGIDDPDAQAMIERLRRILKAANGLGMGGGLLLLANEAYVTSPAELRADNTAGHDGYIRPTWGHFNVEVCPNQPGGLNYILSTREAMFEAFQACDIETVCIWPYDQGGCTCTACAPWGANGFLTAAQPIAESVRRRWPEAKIVLSTWGFDHFVPGEWAALSRAFAAGKPAWLDYLLTGGHDHLPAYPAEHGVPGGLPLVSFAEISMYGMHPWGGFGAIPRPLHWQTYCQESARLVEGDYPYSEGIFEDMSKIQILQWSWSLDTSLETLFARYARRYLVPEVADDLMRLCVMLEEDHGHEAEKDSDGALRYRHNGLPRAEEAETLARAIDARLPEPIRSGWRWQIVLLRSLLDAEIKRRDGEPSDRTDACFEELIDLYGARDARASLQPPSRTAQPGTW